ncbi:retron-type reverse transcriptase [Cohnella nanjingensis]|uniref:Retron-type reverse transcriptase n=1 Tax=Cohnella nanjingensis TaxID=1387779 RepID=A0A7X0RVS1_9BACL|nr:retron-type reverse transcriptase [Cohnella nanjingensis]MBB6673009.1 retron-type reverse transcriptase [Cohnella nanjingensis]
MSDDLEAIKKAAGEYAQLAIAARREFIILRLKQDTEIRNVLIRAASSLSKTMEGGGNAPISGRLMTKIEQQLKDLANQLQSEYADAVDGQIKKAVEIGTQTSKTITLNLLTGKIKTPLITKQGIDDVFVRINEDAVRAMWERTSHGLKLSKRIWNMSEQNVKVMTTIVQDAVATGQDAVQTARMLEQYVRPEANIPVKYMKGLMERTEGIPEDLSYQALRVARTEATAAFGLGTIRAAQASPSAIGIQFCLSPSHKVRDICDELATHDVGLGLGVYPLSDPPPYPAHPNTMSFLVEKHLEGDAFVQDLLAWVDDPNSQPNLESWYQDVYKRTTA